MQEKHQLNFRVKVIAGASLFVLLSLGAVLYFTVFRLQDSEYDTAGKQIDIMVAKVAAFESAGGVLFPESLTEAKAKEAKSITNDYKAAVAELEKSRVITNDSEIAKSYGDMRTSVTRYGESSAGMVQTVVAVANIKQQCNDLLNQIPSLKTLDAFNEAGATCKAMLDTYTSVPLADFNSSYFLSYRQEVKDVIAALDTYYTAGQNRDTATQQKAQVSLTAAMASVAELNNNTTALISNTANPAEDLKKLSALIDKRRTVFWR